MIKISPVFACCLVAFVVISASCSSPPPTLETPQPRTYYETLDLSTPESAVRSFTNAFQRSDFPTVFWIFSPKAQSNIMNRLNLLEYGYLLKLNPSIDPIHAARPIFEGTPLLKLSEAEHFGEISYYFDVLMMAAKEHSALIIDLSGAVYIRDTITSPDNQYADIVASVDGIEGNVIFRTVQSPGGRWRVLQVIVPGGDENHIPWSTPALTEQ